MTTGCARVRGDARIRSAGLAFSNASERLGEQRVAPNGVPQFASQGVTVTRTSTGTYRIDIAAGIFTSAAVPVITPVGGAFVSGLSGNLISTFTVNFSADTGFSVLITQVRP